MLSVVASVALTLPFFPSFMTIMNADWAYDNSRKVQHAYRLDPM